MRTLDSMLFVGGAASGKTELAYELFSVYGPGEMVIPRHYVDRPQQAGDEIAKLTNIDARNFEAGVSNGFIYPDWSESPLEETERHGFENVDSEDDRLRIYIANTAFMRSDNPSAEAIREKSFIMLIAAARATRARRLIKNMPQLSASDREAFLSDDGRDLSKKTLHAVYDTEKHSPSRISRGLISVADTLLSQ